MPDQRCLGVCFGSVVSRILFFDFSLLVGATWSRGRLMRRSVHPFRRPAFIDPSCNRFLAWVVRAFLGSSVMVQRKTLVSSIRVGTPDEAKLAKIISLPCEQFPVAQDALKRPRLFRGTFSFDHLVDRAAYACDPEVGHGAYMGLSIAATNIHFRAS